MTENQNDGKLSFDEIENMLTFPSNEEASKIDFTLEEKVEDKKQEETEDEVKTTPVIEEKKKEEDNISLEQPSIYLQLVKEKLRTGEWEDVLFGNEGEEKPISEIENISEEDYQNLLEDHLKHKEEEVNSKYVKIDGLTEVQKSLINIVKTGDLEKARELFENPQQLEEPFQGYDADNEAHNIQVLSWYYSGQGNSEKEIKALLNVAKEDGTLDQKAEKIVNWQKEEYHKKIKQAEEQVREEKKQEEENIKKYKKELVQELKNDVEEGMARKFADVATKYNQDGQLQIDSIYDEWMKDPKKASRLLHFLLDEEDYLKKVGANTKKEVQKDLLRKVSIVRNTSKASDPTKNKTEEDKFPDLVFE